MAQYCIYSINPKEYYYEPADDRYDDIIRSTEPSLINNVSMLRHYVNCHGITNRLQEYLQLDSRDINAIIQSANCYTQIMEDIPRTAPDLVENCRKAIMAKEYAKRKNERLVRLLKDKRDTLCGIGTKKVKLFLNKQIKQGDINAKLYRLALEAEERNIMAKNTSFPYQEKVYNVKKRLIMQLANECRLLGLNYGYQK